MSPEFWKRSLTLDVLDRSVVLVLSNQVIVTHCKDNKYREHDYGPVHICQRWVWHLGEADQHDSQRQVCDSDDVDVKTRLAKVELGRKEWFSENTFPDHAADDDDVGSEDTETSKGDDDVEGDGGADVDQTQERGSYEGCDDGVDGDVPAWWNLGS